MPKLAVEVWSDIACPWCYVGKRRLEAALARFGHRDEVEVTWRAFELDPTAPPVQDATSSYAARLAAKYRTPVARAEQMIAQMTRTAADDGLDLRFDRIRAGNTFDAHRILHLAGTRGQLDATKERLLRAYFTEGEAIGDRDTLVRLAGEVGLDPDEVRAVLASGAFTDKVRAEQAEAAALGVTGVPFFVIDRRYAVSGAQPAEVLLGALTEAYHQRAGAGAIDAGDAACGADGCG